MAYRFKRKESLTKATRRLGRERVEHALRCLKEHERTGAVHRARKDIKKTRAVVRLVRPLIKGNTYRRLTARLRKAAAPLADPRDADIKIKTLHDLARYFKGQIAPGTLRAVRAELQKDHDDEMKRLWKVKRSRKGKPASAAARSLRRVATRLERLKVSGHGWQALGPGVKTAYRQGRRAYHAALEDPSPENFHAWRKRVKNLWYHLRLLHPIRPGRMETMAGELKTLGERLGVDHDLTVLRHDLDGRTFGDARVQHTLHRLIRLIERRQRALRASALALGARCYDEKPTLFRERLAL